MSIISHTQDINMENIPEEFRSYVFERIGYCQSDVITVERNSDFGRFLRDNGFIFTNDCECLVVYR